MTDREFDAWISTNVMDKPVIAWDWAMCPDGCWTIHPGSSGGSFTSFEPLALDECRCDFYDRRMRDCRDEAHVEFRKKCGHESACLEVIPNFSTDPAADYLVLCKARETWEGQAIAARFSDALARLIQDRCDRGHHAHVPFDTNKTWWIAWYSVGDYSRAAKAAVEAREE